MNWMIKEAESALGMFPFAIRKPYFLVLDRKRFGYYLKDSPLLLSIEETPSFVAHLPDSELVCLCSEIINNLTKNKNKNYKIKFVRAIIMHELFHIRNMHMALTEDEALKSEKEVHSQLRREFPGLANVLSSINK